jgi:large subunit ribosomal protein L18
MCVLRSAARARVATPLPPRLIGKRVAEKAKAAGVEKVAFDRAGFAYHGRVKALADAAREAGLQF